ncbi:hypothetical protein O8C96_06745 [Aliarcobacter butzleri]|uniref:hypothetical protein n=1 Tax=Aliarcobacter butzleri TaxID=28197 RepID=UPI00263D894D|nr:hypothetical protein [Aliarcobacter butzleri]MDN5045402.1 hypothetical protein [Aliarcobacter butzleri]
MNEINLIFDRLFNFFNVSTITELAKKLEMSQPAVTNWQRRHSINAIKKRCRELGIYNEIFGEQLLTTPLTNFSKSLEKKSYIDEDSLFFLEGLFLRAKTQNRLKELKEDIQRLSLNYLN